LKPVFIQRKDFLKVLLFILVLVLVFTGNISSISADGSLIVNYDFNGNFTDSLGNSTLTEFGTEDDGNAHNNATSGFGTDSGVSGDTTYWEWASTLSRGGGFWIDVDSAISSNYSVGVRFAFNSTAPGYKKIIDYKNMTSDNGFYFLGGKLNFYPLGTATTTTIANNQIVDIVATRDGTTGKFTAYFIINGQLSKELEVDDPGNDAYPIEVGGKTRLGFFFDDIVTGGEATDGGKVYSVKIWDGPITQDEAEYAMDPEDEAEYAMDPEDEAILVRTMPITCWQVWINGDNDFQFIFWYPYKNNNWVRIYDMEDNIVFETDLLLQDPNLIVDLPDGMYTVKTFHDSEEPIQEFVIGKP